jgi:DNA-binding winged helix-turn-helix (wHTH) protein/TolB-like protein/cytochrome c-type biogenesis protein CcmH/NrfG
MGLKTRHVYEFGPFRLEPAEHSLLRLERSVAIAPKAFELLVFLVQNQGRLVSKDQIMETIWPGCFVEEANLTVCVSTVRKALGEKDGDLRYIETVPKSGYRFTAPVRELGGAAQEAGMTEEADFAACPGIGPVTAIPVAASEMEDPLQFNRPLAAHPGPALAISQAPEAPAARPGGRGRRIQIAAAVAALFGVVLVVGYSMSWSWKQAGRPRLLAPRTLAILPFQNLRRDSDDDFLGFSLADAAITKLGYVSSLTVRPSSDVEKYRGQVIDIKKVAAELNVEALLTGNFIHEGDDLRITSQLVDAKSDRILWRDTFDLKFDKLLTVQDKVTHQIIAGLELSLSPSEAERLKPDQPINPLAYEYYLRGVDLFSRHDFPLSIKMLEKSAEIDPNYALTWAYLGASYNSDAAFELGGREQYHRAQAAYERALSIQPAQLEAHIFLANLLIDTGKVEQAVPLLREALRTNPNHAGTQWELGYAYRFAGMLNESVAECERARQIDPLVQANGSALNTYLYLGEYDKFLASLPEVNESAFILFYRGFGEYYQKDWERATNHFDQAFELDPSLYTQIGKAMSDSIAHRNAAGLEILHQLESKIQQRGVGDPEAIYKIAQGYAVLGDKNSATRAFRHSVESGFFAYPYFTADPLLDSLRNEDEFGRVMRAALQRHEAFKRTFFENQAAAAAMN